MDVRARRSEVVEGSEDRGPADYASAFTVTAVDADARSPIEWARATFEDAPRTVRWFVLFGWKYVLGLRLGPRPSPEHVLGWSVVSSTADAVRLEAESSLLTAYKVLRNQDSRVVMTTYVYYRGRLGRVVWMAVTPVHHRTEPYLLGRAASQPPG